MSRTLYQVLVESARVYGAAPALRQPSGSGYLTLSWKQYLRAAEEIAAGLRVLGIGKGQADTGGRAAAVKTFGWVSYVVGLFTQLLWALA